MSFSQAFCQSDGLKISYRQGGVGPPLVLLHHAGGSSRRWSRVLPALAQDWSVFAADLPGHGDSEQPEGNAWESWKQFLPAFLKTMDLRAASVIAHSLSGVAVVQNLLAEEVSVEKVILLAPPASHDLPAPIRISRDGAAGRAATWKSFKNAVRQRLAADPSTIEEADWQPVHDDFAQLKVQSTLHTLLPGYPNVGTLPVPPDSMPPLHFVWGDQDRMVPEQVPAIWKAAIPDAQHHVLAGIGHLPMLEAPEVFLRLTRGLLGKTPRRQS